jgi:hypothetical protein
MGDVEWFKLFWPMTIEWLGWRQSGVEKLAAS